MSAHCHCNSDERDPYIEETEITAGAPDGTISRARMCRNCWGLIKVID